MAKWNYHEGNDALGRPYTKSPKQDKYKIRDYWYGGPLAHLFHEERDDGKDFCMVCGKEAETDRAHILAQMYKGSHRINNLHLLCKTCHNESEELDSYEYWGWLMVKQKLYTNGFFTPYEIEYISAEEAEKDGKRDMYFMHGETERKVQQNTALLAKHMMYKDGLTFNPTRVKLVQGVLNGAIPAKEMLLRFFLWLLPTELHDEGRNVFEDIYEIDEWLHMNIINSEEE
jgi:hypothetical protein